jgi:prolactin
MKDVPETILSKAKEIEENNRQILRDLRWIITEVRTSHYLFSLIK